MVSANIAGSKRHEISKKSKSGIMVKGMHDVAVRFSKCCSPVPGDEIVGFVTRGRGVSIHRTDCMNIINLSGSDRASRLIEAEWQQGASRAATDCIWQRSRFLEITGPDLLVDITKIFTEREDRYQCDQLQVRVSRE